MKGKIFKIKNMEDELVLPITTVEAVYSEDGKTLNDELDNMENDINNIVNITKDKKMLISAFNGKNKETLDLYLSTDGKELTPINNHVLFDGRVRDPFTIYKDGYFYCSYTHNPTEGFGISRTKDLIKWENYSINIDGIFKCWAPELFEYDGRVYVILSLQTDNQVENDIYNTSIPFFKQYYSEINLNTMTIGTINEIAFNRNSNKIDSTMILKNSVIYCFVKNEYSKEMEVYTSSALDNMFIYNYTIDYPLDVEGASVSFDGQKYHLILDCFRNNFTIHSDSLDLVNWSNFEVVGNGKVRIQHPSQLVLTDEIKEKINRYYSQRIAIEVANPIKNETNTIVITEASKVIKDGVLKVDVEESVIYIKGSENFIINRIDSIVNRFYINIQAPMGNNANITFINGNNIYTPNGRNLDINTYTGYNESLVEVKRVGNSYRFLTNDYLGCNPPSINLINLAVNGVIDNLELENNAFYFLEGVNQVTINSTSFKNNNGVNPFRCYFTLYSASPSCKLTIKNGGKISTPQAKDFVITGDIHGDCTYQFGRVTVSPNQAPLRRIC